MDIETILNEYNRLKTKIISVKERSDNILKAINFLTKHFKNPESKDKEFKDIAFTLYYCVNKPVYYYAEFMSSSQEEGFEEIRLKFKTFDKKKAIEVALKWLDGLEENEDKELVKYFVFKEACEIF